MQEALAHLQGVPHRRAAPGFTLIELMVVLAVIVILALIAMPNFQDRIVREQIVEAVRWADFVKRPVGLTWGLTRTMPADNAAVELPNADRIVSNLVRSVRVEDGAIHIGFGNQANGALQGKTLSLRPAIVEVRRSFRSRGYAVMPERRSAWRHRDQTGPTSSRGFCR